MVVNKSVEILGEEYYLTYRSFKDYDGRSRATLEFYKNQRYVLGLFIIASEFYVVAVYGKRFRYKTLLEAKVKIMKYFTNT